DPAYATVRAELEQRLLDELKRTGDPRLVDDGRFFETPPMAGPLGSPERDGGDLSPADLRRGPAKQ
ncbi:MAG: hypothetical protein ACYDC1_17155, partial [Limisphaerales bacterium]